MLFSVMNVHFVFQMQIGHAKIACIVAPLLGWFTTFEAFYSRKR